MFRFYAGTDHGHHQLDDNGHQQNRALDGIVDQIEEKPSDRSRDITVKGTTDTRTYNVPYTSRLRVKEGDHVDRGEALTEGSIDPKELLRVTDVITVENYLLREVQQMLKKLSF